MRNRLKCRRIRRGGKEIKWIINITDGTVDSQLSPPWATQLKKRKKFLSFGLICVIKEATRLMLLAEWKDLRAMRWLRVFLFGAHQTVLASAYQTPSTVNISQSLWRCLSSAATLSPPLAPRLFSILFTRQLPVYTRSIRIEKSRSTQPPLSFLSVHPRYCAHFPPFRFIIIFFIFFFTAEI